MKCPSCGAEASGKFCSSCGSPLKTKKCSSCGTALAPGSKFCTHCGKGVSGGSTGKAGKAGIGRPSAEPLQEGKSNVAWWVAGAMFVVAMGALGYPVLTRDSGPAGGGSMGGAGAPAGMGGSGSGLVDLTTMSLEEQGTILFNRVMTSSSNGDVQDVEFFQPKAIVIYEQMDPQDPDGIYHFVLLHLVGEEYEAALARAEQGLTGSPDYVLLLGAAAEAAQGLGDTDGARAFYTHLMEVYDVELGMSRPGYEHHQPMFPAYRERAQAFLNQG